MSVAARGSTTQRGRWAEDMALDTLKARGLEPLSRNYRCRFGEIDLIMRDRDTTVFVEVRMRSRVDFGSGADSVDARKQRRLISTAEHFLQRHPRLSECGCRFDVVSIAASDATHRVEWIADAFRP